MITKDLLHDPERLKAVSEYLPVVASAFSRAARSAARATGLPFGLVCMLDGSNLHFKGAFGLELRQSQRPMPDKAGLFIPQGFLQTTNPEALAEMNALFASRSGWQKHFFAYLAAVPLRGADGHILGALIVLDEQIREFELREIAVLEDVAEGLLAELDLRRQLVALEAQRQAEAQKAPEPQPVPTLEPARFPNDHFHPMSVAEANPVALMAETLDGTVTYWNPAAERLLGYLVDEIVGQSVHTLIPPGRADLAFDELELLHAGGRVRSRPAKRLHRDGQEVDVWLSIEPMFDTDGIVVGFSSALDETALGVSSSQAQPETSTLPALVFSVNADGIVTSSQGAPLVEVLGDPIRAVGQTCFKLLEGHEALLEAICVGLLGEEYEFSFTGDNGAPLRAYIHPIFQGSQPNGILGAVTTTRV